VKTKVTEKAFQAQVIDLAHLCGWRVAHFRKVRVVRRDGSAYWETPAAADGKGFPDLQMLKGGRQVVAELKVEGNKPTPEQAQWLEAFQAAGVPAHVWTPDDWPQIERVLQAAPPKYSATLEPLSLMLRVHPHEGAQLGDDYDWFTVAQNREKVAFIKGMDKPMSPAMMRAADDALRAAGFVRRVYLRVRPDGTVDPVERDLAAD